MPTGSKGFTPPPYPYDRLGDLRELADTLPGGCVDLSVGTPTDPPPDIVVKAMAESGAERGYPPSIGTVAYREAAASWLERRLAIDIEPDRLAACIGTKELVAGVPHWLHLRDPSRDTVLYPAVSYPTYAMGAELAGARAVPVPVDERFRLDLDAVDDADAERALCLWVNTPGNPAGAIDDLAVAAAWGRVRGVPVFSDECYVEFTWQGRPQTILSSGLDGVVAVHSLSKRSNLAGARAGFYAGDAELVAYLAEVRKHAGFMVPGPVQAGAVAAWGDHVHVELQRDRYRRRLELGRRVLAAFDVDASSPEGGFYLWAPAPEGDAWALARRLAERAGVLVSPGEFYGAQGTGHVRVAVVQPDDQLQLVAERLGIA
jgi:succinyldiaminopimelate transaminase